VSWPDAANLAFLIGWLAWALASALALRLVLAALIKRVLPRLFSALVGVLVYAGVVSIFIGSVALHEAAFSAPSLQAWSFMAYTLAPFGLPLLVGSILLLPWDLANCIIPPRGWVR
jgi:hypothetical protein